MAFSIPNQADAFNAHQAEPDSVDIDVLVAAYNGSGVISGCAVTAQGTPDLTVAVASGTVLVAGVRAAVTGANSTIGTADTTNPRIDLITINGSGTIATTAGTAAAIPTLPAIPSSSIVLALIYVPASDTTIASNQIIDKRVNVNNVAAGGADDDILVRLGTDGDIALVHRSTALAANTTLTNVVEGTAATLATAANSLIVGNITNDGDIHLVVSKAGNSHTVLLGDGSTGDTYLNASTGQSIFFAIATTNELTLNATALFPSTDDGLALGVLNTGDWSDLFLATGAVINWENGDVTLTHAANALTLAGGTLDVDLAAASTIGTVQIVTPASTTTFTNKTFDANATGNALSNVDVADLANGTDGELITWSATGVAATVAVGTSTHVLTSNGVGAAPTFQVSIVGLRASLFVPPGAVDGTGATLHVMQGRGSIAAFADSAADQNTYMSFNIPSDITTLQRAVILIVTRGGSNDLRHQSLAYTGAAAGEAWNTNSDSVAAATLALTDELMTEIDVSSAFTSVAAGDTCQFNFVRLGSLAADTIATLDVIGLMLEFT